MGKRFNQQGFWKKKRTLLVRLTRNVNEKTKARVREPFLVLNLFRFCHIAHHENYER